VNARLVAALAYRARGWATLPLDPSGNKQPHFCALERVHGSRAWKPLARRPASEPEIRAWFGVDDEANVGIICGQPSAGLVVADFDRPARASDAAHPPTVVARARRGPHIYFQAAGHVETTATAWGELRGDGAYIVAPPSLHESGHEYGWLIRPDDCPLAPLDAFNAGGLRPEVGTEAEVLLPVYPADTGALPIGGGGSALAKLEYAVSAAARVLGIDAPLGSKFSCVLPGHGPDRRPSAALHRGPDGVWRYMDFHRLSDPSSLTLAEVRASRGAGRVVQLRAPSQARWYRRLFYEAGMLSSRPVPLEPPPGLSAGARQLAQGFALLLALRDLNDGDDGPAPYSRAFAGPWCGMGERQAGEGIAELVRAGVLIKSSQHGRMNLYRPASAVQTRREAA
jgi:hypothetical protein